MGMMRFISSISKYVRDQPPNGLQVEEEQNLIDIARDVFFSNEETQQMRRHGMFLIMVWTIVVEIDGHPNVPSSGFQPLKCGLWELQLAWKPYGPVVRS